MAIPYTVKTTNFELTPAIEAYMEEKFSKVDKFLSNGGDTTLAEIEVGKFLPGQNTGEVYRAEINLKIGGALLRAEAEESDLHAAIDEVQDEIIREIKKFKGKRDTLFRRGARKMKEILHRPSPQE